MANEGPQQSIAGSITITSGSGTLTLTPQWSNARWVRVVPVNETDTFDLTIKDAGGFIMVKRSGITGTYSEKLEMSMGIMSTVNVANAITSGTYRVFFDLN